MVPKRKKKFHRSQLSKNFGHTVCHWEAVSLPEVLLVGFRQTIGVSIAFVAQERALPQWREAAPRLGLRWCGHPNQRYKP